MAVPTRVGDARHRRVGGDRAVGRRSHAWLAGTSADYATLLTDGFADLGATHE